MEPVIGGEDHIFANIQVTPDYKNIILFIEDLKLKLGMYEEQVAKIERFDQRIEELANQEKYQEKVKKLVCFLGIKTHTALSLIVETGDFERFASGYGTVY